MSHRIENNFIRLAACLSIAALALTANTASAQRAGSWVDIAGGKVGAGASADGLFKHATSRSSSKNGVDFGHGFAVGAGPNGIAVSNTIGAGGGPLGVAHNVQLNIGPGGTHVSQGGVVTQGGNRRVLSGGETGTRNGQVYGGSHSTGFGHQTKAWSHSQTNRWGGQAYGTPVQVGAPSQYAPAQFNSSSQRGAPVQRVFRNIRFN